MIRLYIAITCCILLQAVAFSNADKPVIFMSELRNNAGANPASTLHFQEPASNITLNTFSVSDTTVTIDLTLCFGMEYEGYEESGIYIDTFHLPNGDDSIRILNLSIDPPIITSINRDLCPGETFEGYSHRGFYADTFATSSGCDSIRRLGIFIYEECVPMVNYNLDSCRSYMTDGSHMDYSEFIANYPDTLTKGPVLICAYVEADHLLRIPQNEQKHSCTPGVNGSKAMCVSSNPSCTYLPGDPASIILEMEFGEVISLAHMTSIEFYEKAPLTYNWIDGDSGLNNYPTLFGIRLLRNDVEVFRQDSIPTSTEWTLHKIRFFSPGDFDLFVTAVFRFEILPYCPINNGATVSAWDIDEITVSGACIRLESPPPVIEGHIKTITDLPVGNAEVSLSSASQNQSSITNNDGTYEFSSLEPGYSYILTANKNDHFTEGVNILDILRMQRHLLGIEPFISLHQYIAADVDRNGKINVMDMLELKKLLLGVYDVLPGNTSWRFGILPQDLSSTDITTFRENHQIESLDSEITQLHFVGIKIGDVNDDIYK